MAEDDIHLALPCAIGEAAAGCRPRWTTRTICRYVTALGFSAARLRSLEPRVWIWFVALAPAAIAAYCFCLAALQGIGASQRVRLGQVPSLGAVVRATDDQQPRTLLYEEVEATRVSNWSAENLLNEVLQARAWLTLGIIALMQAGAAVAMLW